MPQPQRECLFRWISQPTDVNWGGKVHGGMVMKWMDQAAYACAVGWSAQYSVTASVGGMSFLKPIKIGEIVEVRARVVLTGRSSMHIAVDVDSLDLLTQERNRTTHCLMVFVALDADGQSVSVPSFTPDNEEDRQLAAYAERMKAFRQTLDAEMAQIGAPTR